MDAAPERRRWLNEEDVKEREDGERLSRGGAPELGGDVAEVTRKTKGTGRTA
jgi:hypothetical protein